MIAKNLHNPLPLHENISQWYDKRPTFHGGCSRVVLPKGYLPVFQLTLGEEDYPTMTVSWRLDGDIQLEPFTGSSVPVAGIMSLTSGTNTLTVALDTSHDPNATGYLYEIEYNGRPCKAGSQDKFTKDELRNLPTLAVYNGSVLTHNIRLGNLVATTITIPVVYYFMNDTVLASQNVFGTCELVPEKYRTSSRFGTLVVGGGTLLANQLENFYYLTMTISGHTYTSEPFLWCDSSDTLLEVKYRRGEPILTADNYLPFKKNGAAEWMKMWVKGSMVKPPFGFEVSMQENDGYNMVKKKVSYVSDKMSFLCTSYFADAVRLLWHCNDVHFTYDGEEKVSDYMEPPEVSWDTDRHLCVVTVEFRSDTIIQTNGFAE